MTHNFNTLFFVLKKMVRNQVTYPRYKSVLILYNSLDNHIFHCTKHYYKIKKARKRKLNKELHVT